MKMDGLTRLLRKDGLAEGEVKWSYFWLPSAYLLLARCASWVAQASSGAMGAVCWPQDGNEGDIGGVSEHQEKILHQE